jgi:hypothetical protein
MLWVGSAAVALSVAMGVAAFEDIQNFVKPRKWHGVKLAQAGRENSRDGR